MIMMSAKNEGAIVAMRVSDDRVKASSTALNSAPKTPFYSEMDSALRVDDHDDPKKLCSIQADHKIIFANDIRNSIQVLPNGIKDNAMQTPGLSAGFNQFPDDNVTHCQAQVQLQFRDRSSHSQWRKAALKRTWKKHNFKRPYIINVDDISLDSLKISTDHPLPLLKKGKILPHPLNKDIKQHKSGTMVMVNVKDKAVDSGLTDQMQCPKSLWKLPKTASKPPDMSTLLSEEQSDKLSDMSVTSRTPSLVRSCSQEAKLNEIAMDFTVDELSFYFDDLVHIPKDMSMMAEMMYT